MTLYSQSWDDPACCRKLRTRFLDQPLHHVQIDNFLTAEIADRVSKFLLDEAQYKSVFGLKSVAGHDTEEANWSSAPEEDRLFFNEMLVGSQSTFSQNLHAFIKVRQFFKSDEFCKLVSTVTGLALPSSMTARVHRFQQGHYLRQHHDKVGDRRVAYILYLTPDWDGNFGGELAITGKDGGLTKITPTFNSLVIFDVYTQKEHQIEPLRAPSNGKARLTMSAWLNSEPSKQPKAG